MKLIKILALVCSVLAGNIENDKVVVQIVTDDDKGPIIVNYKNATAKTEQKKPIQSKPIKSKPTKSKSIKSKLTRRLYRLKLKSERRKRHYSYAAVVKINLPQKSEVTQIIFTHDGSYGGFITHFRLKYENEQGILNWYKKG